MNLEAVRLLEDVEVRARERRIFNERRDPFELSDKEFIRLYRVNKRIMEDVVEGLLEVFFGDVVVLLLEIIHRCLRPFVDYLVILF
jgi:hypothetical protein